MTHTGEILLNIKKVITIENSYYTLDGVKATIIDQVDGQKYELSIKPLYQKINTDIQRN